MRVYIAGPMRGIRHYNFPAFDAARDWLEARGHEVISPADIDRQENGLDPFALDDDHDWGSWSGAVLEDVIRRDIEAILSCDAICLLRGYHNSLGATAELAVARWAGKTVITLAERQSNEDENDPA